ncbi:restriction endonuclease subunit S [Aeromonas salmonicida]
MVPKGWNTKPLSEIVKEKISYGIVQAGPHIIDGIPYIKSSDVKGKIDPDTLQKTSQEIHFKYRRSAVHPGDIVFSLRGNIGASAIVPEDLLEANLTQGTARISVSESHCNLFYYYQLASEKLLNIINNLSKGSTFKEIALEELRKVKVLCAPLPEQNKIAKILSTWDKAITTTEQLLANSQQQKKALMQQLLTGKKRLRDNNGVRFSGEWQQCIIEDFFDVGSSKRVLQDDWKNEGTPFYRTRELVSLSKNEPFRSEVFIADELFHELSIKYGAPKPGDFLVSGVGTLGISYQVKDGDRFYFKDGNVLWFKIKEGLFSDYFKYCFQSDFLQEQIVAQASITTVGTYTIQNAKKTKFWCPPSIAEQQKISAVLSTADQEIAALQQKLDALKQEKMALMQQLLTGKKRVIV